MARGLAAATLIFPLLVGCTPRQTPEAPVPVSTPAPAPAPPADPAGTAAAAAAATATAPATGAGSATAPAATPTTMAGHEHHGMAPITIPKGALYTVADVE